MSRSNFTRFHQPSPVSMIGGAAQGGSAKPKEEREQLDREHGQPTEETPSAGDGKGAVGGASSDSRTDQQRSPDPRKD